MSAFPPPSSYSVPSVDEAGLNIHVRARGDDVGRPPVLFVHGASYSSVLYDVPLAGWSWLEACAAAGFAAYALDVRGYGRSHSAVMETATRPYARATDAIKDIDLAVQMICERHGTDAIPVVGGSWGSITSLLYTGTIGVARVERLALYAPIYAETNPLWRRMLCDPHDPDCLNPALGAYRYATEAGTREHWDEELGANLIDDYRDERVLRALVDASLADDPQSFVDPTPSFRAPNGTLVDLWEVFSGRPIYEPADVQCPVALVRGTFDQTSTRTDTLNLFERLGSPLKRYVEIANGSHFISFEREARQVFAETNAFLLQDFN